MVTSQTKGPVKRIIFSNRKDELKRVLAGSRGQTRFLVLDSSHSYLDIREFLAGLEGCEEIDLAQESETLRKDFKTKYIEMLSELNRANDSFFWWAFYFTRKESLYTDFSKMIFFCYLIGQEIRRGRFSDLIVVTDNLTLVKQINVWAASQGLSSVIALKLGWRLKERARSFTLGRMIYTLLRAIHYWLLVKAMFRSPASPATEYAVIATLLDEQCFSKDREYRDTYFGELPGFMSQSGVQVLIYGGILTSAFKVLRKLREKQPGLPIIPWHSYSTILEILWAAWRTFQYYLRPVDLKGTAEIDGIAVGHIVKESIRGDFRSGHFFQSVWDYYSARALARRVKVTTCVIPYENRSWEKMILAGLSRNSGNLRTIGYHHAAVTPAHTHLLLGVQETEVIPLPNTIVMMGEVTKEFLDKSGNYPDGKLRVGCALRQGRQSQQSCMRRREKITNVLVALASSVTEYENVLLFLEKAFQDNGRYQVGIRPHPEFSLDRALNRLPSLKLRYQLMDGPLEDNFDWADVVVYVSSTVGVNALSTGIPVVSIDLREIMDYDPAPIDSPLKWSVADPAQLISTLEKIEEVSDSEFEALQIRAAEFGRRYFYPVTDESLQAFSILITSGMGR